jgi:hypothetical protein
MTKMDMHEQETLSTKPPFLATFLLTKKKRLQKEKKMAEVI